MEFKSSALVIKLSVSDVVKSIHFYETILGFTVDPRYTINSKTNTGVDSHGNFGLYSYVQMYQTEGGNTAIIGLFKDIGEPYQPLPQTGTVPSFIVDDIEATLQSFQSQRVVIDSIKGVIINKNTSDDGYTDHFFFFRDPDNNSLVIRQNLEKK